MNNLRSLLLGLVLCLGSIGSAGAQAQTGTAPSQSPVSSPPPVLEQVHAPDVRFALDTIVRRPTASPAATARALSSTELGNVARLTQTGDFNTLLLTQLGGNGNVASITLNGDRNVVDATQIGTRNRLGISVLGSDNRLPVLQRGQDLNLSLDLLNVNGRTYPIEQVGSGIPLHIQVTPGTP